MSHATLPAYDSPVGSLLLRQGAQPRDRLAASCTAWTFREQLMTVMGREEETVLTS